MLNPCFENWARAQGRKPWRKLPNAVAMRRSRCDEIGFELPLPIGSVGKQHRAAAPPTTTVCANPMSALGAPGKARAGTVAARFPSNGWRRCPLNLSNPRAHIRTRLPRTLADEIVGIAGALETSHCFREFVEGGINLVGTPGKFRLERLAAPLYRPLDRRSEQCRGRHLLRKPGIFRPDQIEHQWRGFSAPPSARAEVCRPPPAPTLC